MQKTTLNSIIEKHYLNGFIESIKWDIKDDNLNIAFSSPEDKSLMGYLKCTNIGIIDGELAIYNTSQFNKLLKIMGENIEIQVNEERKIATKIMLNDSQYELEYHLASNAMIGKVAKVKEPNYEIEFSVGKELITKFANAKKALGDIKRFTFEANQMSENTAVFEINDGDAYSNVIRFNYPITSNGIFNKMPFSSELFNEILTANKNAAESKISISKEGLMKFFFKENNIEVTYFLVRLVD